MLKFCFYIWTTFITDQSRVGTFSRTPLRILITAHFIWQEFTILCDHTFMFTTSKSFKLRCQTMIKYHFYLDEIIVRFFDELGLFELVEMI